MDPRFFTVWVLEIFLLDLNILPFVAFDYVMKWCINVRYFKGVFYGHEMIQLKGTLLEKWVNLYLIDIKAKEIVIFGFTHVTCIHRPRSSHSKEFEMI